MSQEKQIKVRIRPERSLYERGASYLPGRELFISESRLADIADMVEVVQEQSFPAPNVAAVPKPPDPESTSPPPPVRPKPELTGIPIPDETRLTKPRKAPVPAKRNRVE